MWRMAQLCVALLGLSVGASAWPQRDFVPFFGSRGARSLVGTFPFSDVGPLPGRAQRQGLDNSVSSIPFTEVAASYAGGRRCIDKVFMEEHTEYDTVIQCDHSYNRRCAKSLKTTYTAQQEEKCQENFVKKCFIQYGKTAQNVTVTVCRTPLVKDCDLPGEEVCSTEYESECLTEQEIHEVTDDVPECRTVIEEKCEDDTSGYTTNTKCSKWPREECSLSKQQTTKYTPLTKCTKVPVELCGPAGCGFTEGSEECYQKTQTIIGDRPEETCSLDPQRTCKHVTKLVPRLEEVENCFDVPKEVCVRSETNPRKVKKPVIKKWCYVVKCEDECVAAAARGECLPQCETYRGDSKCCAPCPSACLEAARGQQKCSAECQKYSDNPQCCFQCPARCQDAARKGITEPACERYQSLSTPTTPCYVAEITVETCKDYDPECYDEAQRGICSNDCYSKYGPDADYQPGCCGTCPDLCKDYARANEMTYTNGTLDCADFDDESCYFQCPAQCEAAYRNGESLASCSKYTYLPNCYRPCPTQCEAAYRAGETEPACEQYSTVDSCYLPCPTKCSKAFDQEVTEPACAQYSRVPSCYYTPCEETCQAAAGREEQCGGACSQYAGNPKCCFECPADCQAAYGRGETAASCQKYDYLPNCYYEPRCPDDCAKAFNGKRTLAKCEQYKDDFDGCYYEECSKACRDSASRGETNPACNQHAGNPNCYVPSGDCPETCRQKSLWGECPAECKEYEGNPDCCAASCPAKCSNKRRGECSAGGVPECDGIVGCCPEKFDQVFGAGVYLPPPDGTE